MHILKNARNEYQGHSQPSIRIKSITREWLDQFHNFLLLYLLLLGEGSYGKKILRKSLKNIEKYTFNFAYFKNANVIHSHRLY